jgi:eukaryotic-like serine/threonine-protein kinase
MIAVPTRISAEAAAMLAHAPTTIGRFRILGEIGRGSNGVVYEADDPMLGRDVAIKAIPLSSESEFRQTMEANFVREARAAAALNHPNIVTVFDAGETEHLAYIAMERLQGNDLHEQLARGPGFTDLQAAELIARVADALNFAHVRGLIHRDVKPGNIFLSPTLKPKVLDFGVALAARAEPDSTKSYPLIGTPNYVSPEQALGRPIDPRTDIFSTGTILYELVTRRRAFEGATVEQTVAAVIQCRPKPVESLRRDLPAELVRIIHKAMAKAAADRYQSAADLRDDLLRFIGEGVAANGSRGNHGIAEDVEDAAGWLEIALAALVIVGAILGAWYATAGYERAHPQSAQQTEPAPATDAAAVSSDAVLPATESAPAPSDVAKTPAASKRSTETRAESESARPAPAPAAAPSPDGILTFAISPWGEIFVNGASRGVAPPLSRLALTPGNYAIEIRNADNPRFTTRVEIRPGQTASLQHRF